MRNDLCMGGAGRGIDVILMLANFSSNPIRKIWRPTVIRSMRDDILSWVAREIS